MLAFLFLAVDWSQSALAAIGGRRLNNLMMRLRLPKLGKVTYREVLATIEICENDNSQTPLSI